MNTPELTNWRTRHPVRTDLENELQEFFATQLAAAEAYGTAFTELWTVASRHVLGGKLVRPLLFIEAYESLASDPLPKETVLRLAVAIEILHYSFLLHDDVIDGDLTRRGTQNLIGALQASAHSQPSEAATGSIDSSSVLHWARTGGLLMGDLLLSAAHQMFARADLPHGTRLALLDLLDHTVVESVAGEQVDVGLSDGVITPDLHTVLSMSANKTATYSFELPLRAAAILANAPQQVEQSLTLVGYHLGLAFQIQDDLLSVFGDAAEHGKSPFSDLREGKQTVITSYARMTSAWPSIECEFGNPRLTHIEARRMRDLLADCGAEQFAHSLIDEQSNALYAVLASTSDTNHIPPNLRRLLLNYATALEDRKS